MTEPLRHRGKHPSDDRIFNNANIEKLKSAAEDLYYLLDRNYPVSSSLTLVGNRYQLVQRQRIALRYCACTMNEVQTRAAARVRGRELKGKTLFIDGYNLIITLESALAGAYIFEGRDKALRDLSGIHGSYKRVSETDSAVIYAGKYLSYCQIEKVVWVLDAPVTNSGRLKQRIEDLGRQNHWNWEVILHQNPDNLLIQSKNSVATSDSVILDHAAHWVNLVSEIFSYHNINLNLISL